MKFLRFFAHLFLLTLVIQACILPKYFYWQVPIGMIAFYLSLISLFLSKSKLINLLAILVWIVTSYTPSGDFIHKNPDGIALEFGANSIRIDPLTLEIKTFPAKYELAKPLVHDLQQKTGRVNLAKLKNPNGQELSVATLEIGDLYSFAGWEQNKILLRRLAAILRQEDGQVLIYVRGSGPFFHSIAKGFAYQTRTDKIYTSSFIPQLFGFGSDLVFLRMSLAQES